MAGQENLDGAVGAATPAQQASADVAVLDPSAGCVDPLDPDLVIVAGSEARAPRCTANRSNLDNPGRCEHPAIAGANVCTHHGGRLPQVQRVARRRLVEAGAVKELAKAEVVPIGDPVVRLADLAAEAVAIFEVFKAKAAEDTAGDAELALLERSLDRAGKMLEACGRLGIEERRQRMEADQAQLVAKVIRGVVADVFLVVAEILTAAGGDASQLGRIERDQLPAIVRRRIIEVVDSEVELVAAAS